MSHVACISKKFHVQSGVRQGCILLSTLFLFVIDDIPHTALTGGCGWIQWTMPTFLGHLDYGDLVCLISHWVMYNTSAKWLWIYKKSKVGPNININKMCFRKCNCSAPMFSLYYFMRVERVLQESDRHCYPKAPSFHSVDNSIVNYAI